MSDCDSTQRIEVLEELPTRLAGRPRRVYRRVAKKTLIVNTCRTMQPRRRKKKKNVA